MPRTGQTHITIELLIVKGEVQIQTVVEQWLPLQNESSSKKKVLYFIYLFSI